MPTVCCVVSCSNTQKKSGNVSLFRIPAVVGNQGETIRQLSQERRRLWLNAIRRSDDSWRKTEYWRVCSKHFIQGSPSSLLERDNPDWVPSLYLGYARSGTGVECIVGRYRRSQERKERVLEVPESLMELSFDDCSDVDGEEVGEVDMDSSSCSHVEHTVTEVQSLRTENQVLKGKVERLTKAVDYVRLMDISDFKENEKVKFYTGLSSTQVLQATFNLILPGINQQKNCALTAFQKFITTLMRMRLNLQVQDLAYRYNVSASVISKAFHEVIDLLYVNLKQVIHWPAREDLVVSMPMAFREKFGTKVVAIVVKFLLNDHQICMPGHRLGLVINTITQQNI